MDVLRRCDGNSEPCTRMDVQHTRPFAKRMLYLVMAVGSPQELKQTLYRIIRRLTCQLSPLSHSALAPSASALCGIA